VSQFFYTFSEGENLYLVPGFGITEVSVAQFKLSFNKAYDVRIWFHRKEHNQTNARRFKFIARAWDDILFEENYIAWFHTRSWCYP